MDMPFKLKEATEGLVEDIDLRDLRRISNKITEKYMERASSGGNHLTSEEEVKVYSVVRMPATYGAVSDALSYVRDIFGDDIDSVSDIGAGSGAASWACREIFAPSEIKCLEYEDQMIDIGRTLMSGDKELAGIASWKNYDLLSDEPVPGSDLVISSYVINELPADKRLSAVDKMWKAAGKIMVIIEPGTMTGFSVIRDIRAHILEAGGHMIAPCPHEGICRIGKDDWCHFACRVMRSKMHKLIKDAAVPYEDEKYSFIAFSKTPVTPCSCRILRHPEINKGFIKLNVCTSSSNEVITVTKKDKELFKQARKAKQGDTLDHSF